MLALVIAWNVLIICSYYFGIRSMHFLGIGLSRKKDHVMAAVWIGVLFNASLLLAISIVIKLSVFVGVLAISIPLMIVYAIPCKKHSPFNLKKGERSVGRLEIALFIIFELAIAYYCIRPVISSIDTGIYHYQMIQWLSQFGTVPGVALIQGRFGFVSSWFALAAPLNDNILGNRFVMFTGGLAILLFSLHFVISLKRILTQSDFRSDRFVLFSSMIALPVIFRLAWATSSTPNLAVHILVFVVSWTIIVLNEQQNKSNKENYLIPLLLAVGAINIKANIISLAVICYILYFFQNRLFSFKRWAVVSLALFLCVLPFFAANIISSGCPLFPSSAFCVETPWYFNPSGIAYDTMMYAKGYVRHEWWTAWPFNNALGFFLISISSALVLFLPLLHRRRIPVILFFTSLGVIGIYFISWNDTRSLFSIPLYVTLVGPSLLIIHPLSTIFRKGKLPQNISDFKWIAAVGVSGSLLVMIAAPSLRFGLSYFIIIVAYALSVLPVSVPKIVVSRNNAQIIAAIPVIILFVVGSMIKSKTELQYNRLVNSGVVTGISPIERLLLPPPLFKYGLKGINVVDPVSEIRSVNDITYIKMFSNSKEREMHVCWNEKLPCSQTILAGIRLIDKEKGLSAGFMKDKKSDF